MPTATLTDGRIIAVLANPTVDGGWVSTHEDITERHRAQALIAHMASHDALTDLYSRATFEQRLKEALGRLKRHGEQFALLMFDLDKFKSVNDTLGHLTGDAVLKGVAQHINACVREGDTGARLGGDEFIVLLAHTGDPEQAARALANRLLDLTRETFNVGEHALQIGLSIGIALAPKDGTTAEQLLKNVDLALYRAKSEGRGRFRFFDGAIDTPALPEAQPLLAG